MTPGPLGIKNSRRFNGLGSSGIHQKSSAEYTWTSILPLGSLTCRESNGRRFDKSEGSVGVNVDQFSFFFDPLFPPISGRDRVARDDLGRSARCRSLSYQNRINHRGRVRESKNRGTSRGGNKRSR
ncbi:hypothetical protein ALC60_08764 [Trachymyrmex zeteki]|uniref:Uncharacterized protein n=1 Tax=Mycetomoellerius zeteki TaxID=64791 RepID=A0A151WW35_9HYME|nr:hypothetical protein ALC60_08764 [Trachymyrmex zeteki]